MIGGMERMCDNKTNGALPLVCVLARAPLFFLYGAMIFVLIYYMEKELLVEELADGTRYVVKASKTGIHPLHKF